MKQDVLKGMMIKYNWLVLSEEDSRESRVTGLQWKEPKEEAARGKESTASKTSPHASWLASCSLHWERLISVVLATQKVVFC